MTAAVLVLALTAAQVDVVEHVGARLPLDAELTDSLGQTHRLGDYFGQSGKPTFVVLSYFRCPMLCGLVLRGLEEGVRRLDWKLGSDFRVLTVSFDPKDRPLEAIAKQDALLAALGKGTRADWPFLVGDARPLADALGFIYRYDAQQDQYAHPAVIFAVSADGRVVRYLYGVEFPPRMLKLALLEAAGGDAPPSAGVFERVILSCYRYDPATRRYGVYVVGMLRVGGAATLLGLIGTILIYRRRRPERADQK